MHDWFALSLRKRHQRRRDIQKNRSGFFERDGPALLTQISPEIALCPRHCEHTPLIPLAVVPKGDDAQQVTQIAPDIKLARGLWVERHKLERSLLVVWPRGGIDLTEATLAERLADAPRLLLKLHQGTRGHCHCDHSDLLT